MTATERSDFDAFITLLTKRGVGWRWECSAEGYVVWLEHGMPRVDGYSGFSATFAFTPDGELTGVSVGES